MDEVGKHTTENQSGAVIDDGRIATLVHRSPEEAYQDLISRVKKYHPSDDISIIEKAYEVAAKAHAEQFRKSGEPYIIHPLETAIILAELQLDKESIVAGLLHDVVEDTIMTYDDIKNEFGEDVAIIVEGVTKLEKLQYNGDKLEYQAENLRKMFLAMAKDIRVIMVKLADRLHNMRTLQYHSSEAKRVEIAKETLDIYAPLAERLGISKVKVELDDLSLKYINPDAYYELVEKIAIRKVEREAYVQGIIDNVKKHVMAAGIDATFDGRSKHFFSIYRKMINQNKTLDQIYDLFAVRILCNSIQDCYACLGIIHEMYKPIPGRFKDYIAMPKPNMYRSLHTTLIGPSGKPFEIQIRTYEMHREAEYGICSHWRYKETSDGKKPESESEKLSWLREILDWQVNLSDNKEFLNVIKSDLDLFSDHVYCFTPEGDVKTLPQGSNPIDFAYAIHSGVGNKMSGARVNGQLVSINYEIKNGDRVEIITSQNVHGPSRDWLKIVKSTQARNKINQYFRNEAKAENINKGREMMIAYCKSRGIDMNKIMAPEYMKAILDRYGFKEWDAVYAAVGHGGLREGQVINKMVELYEKDHPHIISNEEVIHDINEQGKQNQNRLKVKNSGGVEVMGSDGLAVRFSKCCSPIPGDEIVGYVTRGRGISIHRSDCINIMNLPEEEAGRVVPADWEIEETVVKEDYLVEIRIFATDRHGLLADITRALTEKGLNIMSLNVRAAKNGVCTISTSFTISGTMQLQNTIEKLRQVESVMDIERTRG